MIELKDSHEDKIWSEQAAAASVILDPQTMANIIGDTSIETTEDILNAVAYSAALYADAMIVEWRKRKKNNGQ